MEIGISHIIYNVYLYISYIGRLLFQTSSGCGVFVGRGVNKRELLIFPRLPSHDPPSPSALLLLPPMTMKDATNATASPEEEIIFGIAASIAEATAIPVTTTYEATAIPATTTYYEATAIPVTTTYVEPNTSTQPPVIIPPQATLSITTSYPPPSCQDGGRWGTVRVRGPKTWATCAVVSYFFCLFLLPCCGLFALCCPFDDEVVYVVDGKVYNRLGSYLGPMRKYNIRPLRYRG
jgi:hypothetical protein